MNATELTAEGALLVERTAVARGLPRTITDVATLSRVAGLVVPITNTTTPAVETPRVVEEVRHVRAIPTSE